MTPPFPPTVIFRHRRENLKKCSLEPIKHRADLLFFTYPREELPPLPGYCLLTLGAPLLKPSDSARGLLLIDATWRYAKRIEKQLLNRGPWLKRSLPPIATSYPRKQLDCIDPNRGLASVEALYVAYTLLGRKTNGLLDHYRWKDDFLLRNHRF